MLRWFDINADVRLADIPHRRDYDTWLSRLSQAERNDVFNFVGNFVDSGRIHTSSWMPGPVWKGTPLEAIEKATRGSQQQAGWCFGLILMEVMIGRPEQWYCKKDSERTEGTIYWREVKSNSVRGSG